MVGDLKHIPSIVIHHVELFKSSRLGNKNDLGLEESLLPRKGVNDLVGEAMNHAREVGDLSHVPLAHDQLLFHHIVQPSLEGEGPVPIGKVPHHQGLRPQVRPGLKV